MQPIGFAARIGCLVLFLLASACTEASNSSSTVQPLTPTPPTTTPTPSAPATTSSLATVEEAGRFMIQASFGAEIDELERMVGVDAADWIAAEINKTPTEYLAPLLAKERSGEPLENADHSNAIWDAMFEADDMLRQRMMFALSQLLVVSDDNMRNETLQHAYYLDILSRNAFGNYRDLLEEVTYSPSMAEYLTYMRNRKGNASTGRLPDENYAREILQLFTIGLVTLNADGTPVTPEQETYDNSDIQGLARVFTGLGLKGGFRLSDRDSDARYSRLVMYDDEHSMLEKTFLTTTIPANTTGDVSIGLALDEIFAHPNVGPFVCRQLIQRFTSSSPSPAYVRRVVQAFETGTYVAEGGQSFGVGRRGDLAATIAAILLDDSVHDTSQLDAAASGKLREPVLKFVHWVRAFDISNTRAADQGRLLDTRSPTGRLGMQPFRSPSVFNFYRPGFIAPGTTSGAAGLTAPELQIVNEGSAVGFLNFMTIFITDRANGRNGAVSFTPNYAAQLALADNASELVDHLDVLLTGGQMSAEVKSNIRETVNAISIRSDPNNAEEDRMRRVQTAIFMTIASPAFGLIK